MSTLVPAVPPEPLPPVPSWGEAILCYTRHLRARGASPRTIETVGYDLVHLRGHLEASDPDPLWVALGELRAYQLGLLTGEASRRGRPLAASSVARVTVTLRGFFAFLSAEGLLPSNPAQGLERPRTPRRLCGSVLSVSEVKRLLRAADSTPRGLRDRTALEVLYATAVRRMELLGLDLSDLDHTGRTILVRRGKGGKDRLLPLTRSSYQALSVYLERARPALAKAEPCSALFLSQRGRRLSRMALAGALTKLARAAGLSKTVSPHVLRRSCATALLKNKVSLRHIQLLLGHADLSITSVYLRLDTSELRQELLLRHPRERFEL